MERIIYISIVAIIIASCGNQEKPKIDNTNTEPIATLSKETNLADTLIENIDSSITIVDTTTIANNTAESIKNTEELVEIVKSTPTPIDYDKNLEVTDTSLKDTLAKQIIVEEPKEIAFEHQLFDKLLRKYVNSSGKVNYKGFKANKSSLDEYINQLKFEYANIKSWNKNKRLAFWINTYNANTIKLIVDNYPISSIKKINGGKPWDKKIIKLGEANYSLNDIENNIIRKRFKESRIHFAVNCAAKSCPKILNKAWTEKNLNKYLNIQTKAFLANTIENQITENEISISKIFEWYMIDFSKSNNILPFVQQYSKIKVNDDATVKYNEYNWDLNE